ncbi:MAG: type II toxin-antitoxin system prevent-host-death family antitoxin [Polaromonas sp.]|nr:type II toxin-antitoxin system prevent-host-death family antitoxin [Polaromonas sp.]
MKSQSVPLREANQNFSRIIAAVEQGEAFSITRRGREVARLLPASDHSGDSAVATTGSGGPDGESTLVERVLRLEARLDKLAAALSATDKSKK